MPRGSRFPSPSGTRTDGPGILRRFRGAAVLLLPSLLIPLLRPDREVLLHLGFLLLCLLLPVSFSSEAERTASGGSGLSAGRRKLRILPGLIIRILWFSYLLLRILIIPLASFHLWFGLAETGKAGGSISSLFAGLAFFFTGSPLPRRKDPAAVWARGFTVFWFFLALIRQSGLLLMPALLSGILALRLGRRELFSREPRGIRPGIFLPAGLALTAALLLSLPGGEPRGMILVDRYLFPSLRSLVAQHLPAISLFELTPGYGYGYASLAGGEKPVLTPGDLYRVEGEPWARYYLREGIYSVYDAGRWTGLPEDRPELEIAFGPPEEAPEQAGPAPEAFGPENTGPDRPEVRYIRVTLLADFEGNLLSTGDTGLLYLEREEESRFDTGAGGIRVNRPLTRGESYRLYPVPFPGAPEEQTSREIPPPDPVLNSVEGIPPGILELGQSLKDPGGDPRETARNISRYLADRYTYSLDTREPRGDLTVDFLFHTRRGYCLHFTTAFIQLYRACGFPARFVTGYLAEMRVPPDREGGFPDPRPAPVRRLNGYTSHTWPEIWLPREGWITWETTPPMMEGEWTAGTDPLTGRLLRETGRISGESGLTGQASGESGGRSPSVPLLLVFLLAAGAGAAAVIPGRKYRRKNRTARLLEALARKGTGMGLPSPGAVGWGAWSRELALLSGRKSVCRRTGFLAEKALFSRNRRLTHRDRRFLEMFLRRLGKKRPGFSLRRTRSGIQTEGPSSGGPEGNASGG